MTYFKIKRICFYPAWLFALFCGLFAHQLSVASDLESVSGSAVYRCGAEYTNRPAPEKVASCERLDDAVLSVVRIEGTSVYQGNGEGGGFVKESPRSAQALTKTRSTAASNTASSAAPSKSAPANSESVSNRVQQKKRESDAVVILQAELQKTKLRRSDVEKEYAKTKDAKLKSEMGRLAADEAGIARELSRMVN